MAQLSGAAEYTACISAEEQGEFPGYDTKQSKTLSAGTAESTDCISAEG